MDPEVVGVLVGEFADPFDDGRYFLVGVPIRALRGGMVMVVGLGWCKGGEGEEGKMEGICGGLGVGVRG